MSRILLGVSGGIAAYKAVEFARLATSAGHSVRVVMTQSARRFVGIETFEGITGAPVLTSEFEEDPMGGRFPGEDPGSHEPIGHLEIASLDQWPAVLAEVRAMLREKHGIDHVTLQPEAAGGKSL